MKKMISCMAITVAFSFVQKHPAVSLDYFSQSKGSWKGTITYLDYSSGKPFSMAANTTVLLDTSNGGRIILAMEYTKEPNANGNDTLPLSNHGTFMNGEEITLVRKTKQGVEVTTTNPNGIDGNDHRKCMFRHSYVFYGKQLSWKKEVLFNGEKEWIKRNQFSFTR